MVKLAWCCLVVLVLCLLPSCSSTVDEPAAQRSYDWGVAYFMPYDNNLDPHGPTILARISNGMTSKRVVAAVQADQRGPGGMTRFVLRDDGVESATIDREESASEAELIGYLDWFMRTFPCKRYVLVIMGHGGDVDQLASDEGSARGKRWMSGQRLGNELRARFPGRFELLFLQQCGRASLENLYSYRGTADYILCSPILLGAPNSYYAELPAWLAQHPEASGDQVAARIMNDDEDFGFYTCVRAAELEQLPAQLDAVVKPFLKRDTIAFPEAVPTIYLDERLSDAAEYWRALSRANGVGQPEVDQFAKWLQQHLIASVRKGPNLERFTRPARPAGASPLCGVSMLTPETAPQWRRHGRLDLYKACRLPELWQRLGE